MKVSGQPPVLSGIDMIQLVNEVLRGSVIPVLGRNLLEVPNEDGRMVHLDHFLAARLAERLGLSTEGLPPEFRPWDVAARYLADKPAHQRKRYATPLYGEMFDVYKDEYRQARTRGMTMPPALEKLARITDIKLYITTTSDPLMMRALEEFRPVESPPPVTVKHGPQAHRGVAEGDLPMSYEALRAPVVYYLCGLFSAGETFVLTEEDQLEYLHAFHASKAGRPHIFDALGNHHLLFLGCCFEDWLARFFVRILRDRRLRDERDVGETISDEQITSNQSLNFFLRAHRADVDEGGRPEQLIDALYDRWERRRPQKDDDAGLDDEDELFESMSGVVEDAFFLSYAHEDQDRVRKLAQQLRAAGVPVWMDESNLSPGDEFQKHIYNRVSRTACGFVPVISRNTERRLEGWFRQEWYWAAERLQKMHGELPWILPVALDPVNPDDAKVPDAFRGLHWTTAPGGEAPAELMKQARDVLRTWRRFRSGFGER